MTRKAFEKLVEDAVMALPGSIRAKLDNVGFVIEQEPPDEQPEGVAVLRGDELLGLYEGTALVDREFDYMGLPDKISIYVGPHLRMAEDDGEELVDIVRDTVWHEIGHYLGFDEEAIRAFERKWARKRARKRLPEITHGG